MSPASPRPNGQRVTLPQVLALMAIWTAVIYGLTTKSPPDVEQISLKGKTPACASKES
jgi:hypothetical protein